MKADAKPTFADVAQLIAKGPAPDWLVSGLALLSAYVRDTVSSAERKEYADEIDRLRNAIKTLRRLLPLFLHLPIVRCPDDVVVVLDALPRIEATLLARANLRPEKRTPDVQRKCCCAVILEASRLIQLDVQHRSGETYSAYNAYWKACDNQAIVENRNWDRSINRALAADNAWIREIFQRLLALQMSP
jgi:hypothetical protein